MQNELQKEIVKWTTHIRFLVSANYLDHQVPIPALERQIITSKPYCPSPYEVRRYRKAAVEIIEHKDGVLLDSLCTDESAAYEIIQEGGSELLDSRLNENSGHEIQIVLGMLRIALTHELARRGLTIVEDVYGNNPTK